jgi:shikimate kinase
MRLSFIGMSNIGKTYWSKRIAAESGYVRIDCDWQIERRLAGELAQGGHRGLRGVAKWMGFPFDPQYKRNSDAYIATEQIVMRNVLDHVGSDRIPTVIDTTGSVIYTGDDILSDLRAETTVVYFEASEEHIAYLFKRYMTSPKPVIWGENYVPRADETSKETLKRCYPDLLQDRMRRYAKIADVTIPFARHKDRSSDIAALIKQQTGAP